MITKISRYFLILMFLLAGTADASDKMVITLDAALRMAKEKNKNMLIVKEENEKAGAQVTEARSGALPQIFMNSTYDRNIMKPAFFLKFGDEIQKITMGMNNSIQNSISFSQPLWKGGKIGAALKIAKAYENSSEYGVKKTWKNVRSDVKKSFYTILLTKEARRIAEMSLKQAEAHYENVKKHFNQGMSSEFDLLRAEVNASNYKPGVIEAKNNLELAYVSLKYLLGIDIDKEIDIEGEFSYELIDEIVMKENRKNAVKSRADFREMEYLSNMYKLNIKIEKGNRFPDIYLTGGYQFQGMADDFNLGKQNRSNGVAAGLKMEFSIFDGLKTYSRVRQAQSDYRKIEYQKSQLIDGIKMEIKQSELRMKEAQERVETQRQNVIQAEKALKIAEVRYSSGIGTQLELFDAQLIVEQARMGHVQGIYDYLTAKTDWEKAVGL